MSDLGESLPVDPVDTAVEADEDILMSSIREVADALSTGFAALDDLGVEEVEARLRLLSQSIDVLRDLLGRLERVHEVAVAAHRLRSADAAKRETAREELLAALEKLDELV